MGGILVLFIYITRLESNEIFSPSNKIHREVDRAKDLSAPLLKFGNIIAIKGDYFPIIVTCPIGHRLCCLWGRNLVFILLMTCYDASF